MKKTALLLTLLFFTCFISAQVNLSLATYATGFNRPLDITHCGDDRLFVVEKDGAIRILDGSGNKLPEPFLDINPIVGSTQSEQGLLGLAFHPDYLNNGYFFVNYTNNSGDTRVSRFSVSAADPNVADPGSELVLLEADQPYGNHNGGCVKFGPDGYLYILLGDGGSGGDPQNNGQKRTTFLGKILRIDVDNGTPYGIPADNPFLNDPNTLDEIWALGVRNPWRASFDRVTGDFWIADVGQNEWEEIDFQPAGSPGGENYGWRCYEGDEPFATNGCPPMSEMTFPVFVYENTGSIGCSVTGGFVYRGCEFPGLYGHYLFTDFCSGRIWATLPDGSGGWTTEQVADFANNQYVSFGENSAGALFLASLSAGTISRVTSDSPLLSKTDETCEGESDGSIQFTIPVDQLTAINWSDGSNDVMRTGLAPGTYSVEAITANGCIFTESITIAGGSPLPDIPTVTLTQDTILSTDPGATSYQWYVNNEVIEGANDPTLVAQLTGEYYVVITNDAGCEAASDPVMVSVVAGTEQAAGFDEIRLSPNPFSGSFELRMTASTPLDFEWILTDGNGKRLQSGSDFLNGTYTRSFLLPDLTAGMYVFTVKTKKGEWSKVLLKQ